MMKRTVPTIVALFFLVAMLAGLAPAAKPKNAKTPPPLPPSPLENPSSPHGKALLAALETAQYQFTPEVRTAAMAFAREQALAELSAAGKTLPADFLAWVDGDPVVAATVYGQRLSSANVLLMLRSLELDLGQETVRKNYTQLALAMAVVHAKLGPEANLAPHEPIRLAIGGDPRKPVNTKDPSRTLDVNDHIINFLNDHAPIEEEVVVGHKMEFPELKYDDKGVAIPGTKGKGKKVAITEKRTRPLYACDVMASKALQDEFNAYMKAHGQSVQIDCGDHIIYRDRHDGIRGPEGKRILEAYKLFRAAYEAKGLLPAQRDPKTTPAESMAFLIRNNEYKFPADTQPPRRWPQFPLNAPWPVLTFLADDSTPLREREDLWVRFRDKGEFHKYGEYIGGIAQQYDFQSARRLQPFAFTYGSVQMMFKDGGVCGTMATISVRSHNALGIPACTAGQPGHCALISFAFDSKTNTYKCHGQQYATGGDAQTHPHANWCFGDVDAKRGMVHHQSIGWAVNNGLQSFLDSSLAWKLCRQLPDTTRKTRGLQLLESALAANPLNFLLIEGGQSLAPTPQAQIEFWQKLQATLPAAVGKPGCQPNALFHETIRNRLFGNIAKLPVPADKQEAQKVYDFLVKEKCDAPAALVAYQLAIEGLPAMLSRVEAAMKQHVGTVGAKGSAEDDEACTRMADAVKSAAASIPDKKQRQQWAAGLLQQMRGREKYFGNRNKVATDPTATALSKLAGVALPREPEMVQSLLDRLAGDLKASVAGERTLPACKQLAARITAAGLAADGEQKKKWAAELTPILSGHETFLPANAKKNAKPQRDPCADALGQLLAPATPKT